MIITDLQEKNWDNFFANHLQDWQGVCTKYSPQGEMFEYFESLRSFRGNQEKTQVIQNNEYKYPDGRIVEKTWQINKQQDNLADGLCHVAIPAMRTLFFEQGAAVWFKKELEVGVNFAVELLLKVENGRNSVTTHYDGEGNLIRATCIREDINGSQIQHWTDEMNLLPKRDFSGNWQGTSITMLPDLQVSDSVKRQLHFPIEGNKNFFFPSGISVSCPSRIALGTKFTIVANLVTALHLQQLAVNYDDNGAFTDVKLELFSL
ncbi:hypothetical protein NIES4071_19780 [Calothrix sp. NIES-4071]|nr:hypothetical protein NIES4071_19780 [Calothrix sp. NIES-4071]BAZ56311.1 hypothetical protein NIES4105_19730 [Calothrix sp. NIES-4105]